MRALLLTLALVSVTAAAQPARIVCKNDWGQVAIYTGSCPFGWTFVAEAE